MSRKEDEQVFLRRSKKGYVDAVTENGKIIMRFDQRNNLVELNSETGEIKLNGYDLQRVNGIDIHLSTYSDARVAIDLDVTPKKILLLIEGNVKWLEGVDREKYLHGQKD